MSGWFYAKGGKQAGPVTHYEIQRMLRCGELNPEKDLGWQEGMKDWAPLGQIPELSQSGPGALTSIPESDPGNPYAAPQTLWPAPERSAIAPVEEIEPGSDPLDVGACIGLAWQLVKANFGLIILMGLVCTLVTWAVDIPLSVLVEALAAATHASVFESITLGEWTYRIPTGYGIVHQLASQVLATFLSLGTTRIGLNLVSGKPASIGMIFGEGRKLLRAIGASILYGLMVFVGLLLLIVPGIYLALRFGQYLNAIVDRDLGVIDSFRYSSKITQGNRLNLLVLGIFCFMIVLAGVLALIVGLIVAVPIVWLASFVAYRWLQYGRRGASEITHS